jgi:hypothetical protein
MGSFGGMDDGAKKKIPHLNPLPFPKGEAKPSPADP